MASFVERYRRILANLGRVIVTWVAAVVVVAAALAGWTGVAAWVAAALVVAIWALGRAKPGDPEVATRGLLIPTLALGIGESSWWFVVAVAAVVVGLLIEPGLRKETKVVLVPRHLPGYTSPLWALSSGPLFDAGCLTLFALALVAAGVLPPAGFAVLAVVAMTIGAGFGALDLWSWQSGRAAREIEAAITAYRPRFAIYYSGTPLGAYQIQMWLPYLERTGERYIIVVREVPFLPVAAAMTTSPVVYVRSLDALEKVMAPSLGAVFYVNNEAKNVNGVRFPAMRHVHLGHGDSDKPASYNAATAMFDLIFVAGQAGADRYRAHGIDIPEEKFVLVGRPQVEELQVRAEPAAMPARPTVLYAPTWRGGLSDMSFGSLRIGAGIVKALLAQGARVVFRPHPYSVRDSESRVLIAAIDALLDAGEGHLDSTASAELSIFECMNASDALVTDISSVASDYLYTRKPFAITDMGVTAEALAQEYPIARAAYVLDHRGDPAPVIAAMLSEDPLATVRDELRRYYLGPWDPAGYSEVFTQAARAAIEGVPAAPRT